MAKNNNKETKQEFEEKENPNETPGTNSEGTSTLEDNLPASPIKGAVAENETPPTPGMTPEEPKVLEQSSSDPKTPEGPVKGHVTGTPGLRIRHLPNLKSQELGIIHKGEEVLIDLIDSTETFYAVRFNKIEGFCLKEYITLV